MALICSTLAALIATACPEQPQPSVATPVQEPVSLISATSLKQEAILGAPSRLQMIALQQSGTAVAPQPELVADTARALPSQPAVLEAVYRPAASVAWHPVSADRPNIFGSSAMPVGATSLDAKWRRVSATFSRGVPAARHLASAGQADGKMGKLELVNGWVNRHVKFVSDIRGTGRSDLWSSAVETLGRGQGDCEDYAIAKLQILQALGFSSNDLYLAVVRDLVRRADHAVLVVRVDGRFVVLDNNVDRVLDSGEVADYRPIITYAASGKAFVHGYQQPVRIASADASVSPSSN